jgi:hypothetical protein
LKKKIAAVFLKSRNVLQQREIVEKAREISIAEWKSHLISTFPRSMKTTANNKSNLQKKMF